MINNLRWIGVLGAVYVSCAAVGTAQAAGPDDRAEARGPGAIAAVRTAPAAGSDDRVEALGFGAIAADRLEREAASSSGVIHADDRSGLRGSDTALTVLSVPGAESAEDGFAWDDVALSMVATLAVGALLGAGAVSIRYRRSVTLR